MDEHGQKNMSYDVFLTSDLPLKNTHFGDVRHVTLPGHGESPHVLSDGDHGIAEAVQLSLVLKGMA